MLLKKSTTTLCASGSLVPLSCRIPAPITSSSHSPSSTPHTAPLSSVYSRDKAVSTGQWRPLRSYATVKDSQARDANSHDDSHIPSWPESKHPTPYEIFHQAKSAPYSKKAFYDLVKLYHPDRHGLVSRNHSHNALSHTTKLERYRLVVAANNILSDPTKRRAYDLYGAGWAGVTDMQNAYREADKSWRCRAGSAAYNATWEDWERWYEQQQADPKKKQKPVYMSNGLFVGVLVVFVVAGSWQQATRAGSNSTHLLEMRETHTKNISEDMWRKRREKAYMTRDERVQNFLDSREGWDQGPVGHSHMPRPRD